MEIRKVLTLRGPNIWANFPVLEAWVDLGQLKDSSSDEIPGFNDRLKSWLPSLVEHRCSVGERGGFFERLRRGTYLAHIWEHVVLELQALAGADCGFGRTRETETEEGVYKVAIEYDDEALCRAAMKAGRELCLAAVYDRPFDVSAAVAEMRRIYQNSRLGPSTQGIVDAAKARGIPTLRLSNESLVQLGWGAKQRRIMAAATDQTSSIADTIAQDKDLTRSLLSQIQVPVPEGRPVESAEDAWEAAQEIGLPVVVKPRFGSKGCGVATNLQTREQVLEAYAAARAERSNIIVEKHILGDDYRLLIIGGKFIAAARREPARVVGDGVQTVRQLVDEVNRDPRRGEDHATCLSKMPLDEVSRQVLAEQGYTVDAIPPAGQTVLIRRNANLSTGGTATDVTDLVHPEMAARAIDAARMVGLDIAGVDVVCQDPSRTLEEQGGVIVEVNGAPGLRMHSDPSSGKPRPVGQAIVSSIFPEGQTGRIPVVAVTGVNGKTTTTRFIAHLVRQTGRRVGMTCTEGVFLDDRRLESGDCSGPNSAQKLLMNPYVEAAVLETARGGILRSGLAFDCCDVAVVTNIGEGDHLGMNDIETLEKLARVKRVPVEAVGKDGAAVLNAADPYVAEMATRCKGNVVFFARDPDHAVILKHRAAGGRAVTVREGTIMLVEGDCEIPLIPVSRVPLTHEGRIGFQVENSLAAVGAAWSLGLTREVIRAGLETFSAGIDHVPGRFNLLEVNSAAVVVDYGHNTSSLAAMFEALENFPHQQRAVVYTVAGDRRDIDMVRQGELLGQAFDRVILYEDHYVRGRQPGEIMSRLREGLAKGHRVQSVEEVYGAVKAIDLALATLRPGELLLLQADTVDETVAYVRQYLETHQTARQVSLQQAIATAQPRAAGSVMEVVLTNGYANGHAGSVHVNGNGHAAHGHNGNGHSHSSTTPAQEPVEAAVAVALAD